MTTEKMAIEEKNKKRNWKSILIHPKFQITMLVYSVTFTLLITSIQFFALKRFFKKYMEQGQTLGLPEIHPFFSFIQEQEAYMNWVFIMSSAAVFIFTVVAGLVLSHRIVGPLHRLKTYFANIQNVKEGEDLTFRKNDYFQDLPPVINQAVSQLKDK